MTTDWYYGTNNERHGPVALDDLQQLIASGEVNSTDLAWSDGFYDWKPIGQVAELKRPGSVTSNPPPLPVGLPAGNAPVADHPGKKFNLSVWKNRASQWWSGFLSNAQTAGQLVAKQAEKTKLTTVTLPAAYRELGRHVFDEGRLRNDLASNFEAIDRLNSEIAQLAEKPADFDAQQAIAEKAKAMANSAKRTAQRKVFEQKLALAYAGLGKTAFEQHGEACGPANLVSHVTEHQARLETLDAEIAELTRAGQGQVWTPKRIAIAGGCVAAVLCVVVLWSMLPAGISSRGNSCEAFIYRVAELHGTNTWKWTHASGARHPYTMYRFTKAKRAKVPLSEALDVLGQPDLRKPTGHEREEVWVFECGDGVVKCTFFLNFDDTISLEHTTASGRRTF